MENYTPNSHKFKAEQKELANSEKKKVEKIVKGNVIVKKKSGMSKLADIFISEDVKNVKSFIIMDVLVPSVIKALSDIAHTTIDMILPGGSKSRNKGSGISNYVSYRDYYGSKNTNHDSYKTRNGFSCDDIVLETRGEAEEVLSRLDELIDMYGSASVADLYDLVGKTCNYTDDKYGWTNVRNAEPVRVRDGYLLKMPKVTTL